MHLYIKYYLFLLIDLQQNYFYHFSINWKPHKNCDIVFECSILRLFYTYIYKIEYHDCKLIVKKFQICEISPP